MTNNADSELFKIMTFVRRYPIPFFAGIGLLIGSIFIGVLTMLKPVIGFGL
ncbi:hypothetical protein BG20_I1683 [Candidatus Nitrosarchaeum limnium BG20]|uniref:Uncharacterized protein n=1 Tax=Candidatus Nitrosarchaeum limnium BG20 TaxID=859192 RepID=S2EIX2_9ARCH|nr:hypothetical protein BG20_I1683 [Candidatus Nitrosarchaeum limnium BG20]